MAIPLLICDDSSMARKQVARSLPTSWSVEVSFAKNGLEALEAIRAGKGEMVFLDLTMPEMDGYGVLETVKNESLKCVIIVISGDIQPEARKRVRSLGALEFIKKPINQEKLCAVLETYGLMTRG
ncbi:MAG: response regulator [Cellvibrionaceae bacterium]|nr:response regulator [Cellvibrionaceae bacterium]